MKKGDGSNGNLAIDPEFHRAYLSTFHLCAAYFAAEHAKREEELNDSLPISRFKHRGFVITAITESVCFLEAAINEVLTDSADEYARCVVILGEENVSLLRAIWRNGGDRLQPLAKYSLVAEALRKGEFDKGGPPYQDMKFVIDLRNYLVHYKPHNTSGEILHDFEKKLKGKFADNALTSSADRPGWFPHVALGAGCAEWAWKSARKFVDAFSEKIGIELHYKGIDNLILGLPD